MERLNPNRRLTPAEAKDLAGVPPTYMAAGMLQGFGVHDATIL